ncbi:HAMP domain-containing histidine kinase [Paenibacillus pasadenensis]|uniref:HAMP domain-containing sensor histidine kinase n=1 Tax=Paenibacillus pasadenensis TaxID=217090 RepID=UPI002041D763|nr:HAMP domain-containing sensor histidine kinase [Paenibacillus pasadenensis]MCM3747878.1 HAMP domain-containing histidine kinase [Paenibacillus pasadenensis]
MDRRVKKNKQTSILSYWTLRYVAILCVGFGIIVVSSLYLIRETATDNRLKAAGLLGQEIADRVAAGDGRPVIPPHMDKLLGSRLEYFNVDGEVCILITDRDGKLLYSMPYTSQQAMLERMTADLKHSKNPKEKAVTTPVVAGEGAIGQVTLLMSKNSLAASSYELELLLVMLGTLILSGWLTLYLLSRKLSLPIRKVAEGARLIRAGQYDVDLNVETREREIHELVDSFKEMAGRLKQLEEWRALSLGGVTHELKTPVTSIKGLLMAVRDGVVTQEEAQEFVDIAVQETGRLERMVSDLLDYNALSAGSVEVVSATVELRALVSEIVYQWELTNRQPDAEVSLELPGDAVHAVGDALRIQQIVVNLLNNARQAASSERPQTIRIRVAEAGHRAMVEVADNGIGIDPQEAPHIFERFYRGEKKRLRTRGLGLGLTYSCLLARAQGGELSLLSSSPDGSVFVLNLPLSSERN